MRNNYVNGDFFNKLSSDLQKVIIDTDVISGHGKKDTNNFTSTDKIYLLSGHEVYEDGASNKVSEYDTAYNNTRQLDYYENLEVTTNNYSGAIKQYNSSNNWWWLRTAGSDGNHYFLRVNSYGDWAGSAASTSYGFAPAFRIG